MENKKIYQLLDKKTVNKSYLRWMMFNLASTSFEFLESFGFAYAIQPIADKLYKNDPEAHQAMMKRHSKFYNTEPQLGAIVNGIVIGMEEQRALGQNELTDDFINSVKVGLMGPLAGIGDSMIPGTIIPILLSIGMGLASGGNVLGPLFYIIAWNLICYFGSRFLFYRGYELGADSVNMFIGRRAQRITQAISVLGIIVTGGIAANYVKLSLPITIKMQGGTLNIQTILDGIFPSLLPLLLVILSWWLMAKKGVSALKLILGYFVIAVVGVGIAYLIPVVFK